MTTRAYAVGEVLAGKYRIERKIGEGAMGVVLAATHLGLEEPVAIKFMRPDVQRMAGTLSRFAREAKIAARIRSEHVPKVLDVGVVEPIGPYIVMEYLEGRSLADVIESGGPLPVERAVEYVLQACEGLAAAHAIGVIHRDIKPDNLFLATNGGVETIKLLDFGISKASLTGRVFGDDLALGTTTCVMGTPLYMSPEQIRSSPDVDARTDIWSMGAVLYELVTGKTAFNGGSMTEICAMILERPAPPLEEPSSVELAAAYRELGAIIECCLQKEPERRFQSIADLALALLPLAPFRARAYADRSSCILRASSPFIGVAAPLDAPPESGVRGPWSASSSDARPSMSSLRSAVPLSTPPASPDAAAATSVYSTHHGGAPAQPEAGAVLPARLRQPRALAVGAVLAALCSVVLIRSTSIWDVLQPSKPVAYPLAPTSVTASTATSTVDAPASAAPTPTAMPGRASTTALPAPSPTGAAAPSPLAGVGATQALEGAATPVPASSAGASAAPPAAAPTPVDGAAHPRAHGAASEAPPRSTPSRAKRPAPPRARAALASDSASPASTSTSRAPRRARLVADDDRVDLVTVDRARRKGSPR